MSDTPTKWYVEVLREDSREASSQHPLIQLRNELRNPPRWRYLITYNDRGNIGRIQGAWCLSKQKARAEGEAKARALYGDPNSDRGSRAQMRQAPPPSANMPVRSSRPRRLGFPTTRE